MRNRALGVITTTDTLKDYEESDLLCQINFRPLTEIEGLNDMCQSVTPWKGSDQARPNVFKQADVNVVSGKPTRSDKSGSVISQQHVGMDSDLPCFCDTMMFSD